MKFDVRAYINATARGRVYDPKRDNPPEPYSCVAVLADRTQLVVDIEPAGAGWRWRPRNGRYHPVLAPLALRDVTAPDGAGAEDAAKRAVSKAAGGFIAWHRRGGA